MPIHVSADDLRRWRVAAQLIEAPGPRPPGSCASGPCEASDSAAATVRHLGAMQAQDFAAACWAVGLRTPGCTRAHVLEALDAGQIVRSWPMRGTLHFVAAEDLGWMLSVTSARMLRSAATRERGLGIDAPTITAAADAIAAALSGTRGPRGCRGSRALGRSELLAVLEAAGIETAGARGYHLLWHLAQTGLVCWGPSHGTQQAMVLLDEWVPEPRRLTGDEALREFVLRYLLGHGPATLADFVWWSKVTVAEAKRALAAAGDAVASVVLDDTGVEYWLPAGLPELAESADPASSRARKHRVHALPGFDEYVLGYRNRSLVLQPEHADLIVPGGNGVFQPTIVAGGRVTGTWRRTSDSAGSTLRPMPFTDPPVWQRAGFARAADAYARFLGDAGSRASA